MNGGGASDEFFALTGPQVAYLKAEPRAVRPGVVHSPVTVSRKGVISVTTGPSPSGLKTFPHCRLGPS